MTETDYREIEQLIEHLHSMAEIQHPIGDGMTHMVANTMEVLLETVVELEEELKITKKKLEDYRDLDCLLCK